MEWNQLFSLVDLIDTILIIENEMLNSREIETSVHTMFDYNLTFWNCMINQNMLINVYIVCVEMLVILPTHNIKYISVIFILLSLKVAAQNTSFSLKT